ncbi:MAG: Suppressor of fused domain protein [Frankiales bacterium]|nr:Suppressor of fused domain protein [Frankiales bacterium]MCW2586652.1 Suppressor of fused domain protein [Frankiales bacterium]
MTGDEVLLLVEAHLVTALGQDSGRAGVSFLGTERIDVLRFGPDADGLVRYASLGMSRAPMADPGTDLVAQHGPRAELVLSVRGGQDSVLRRLATLAASPAVEGVVLGPGAGLDLGEPLWDGSRFTAVLVGQPGGLVPDLELDGDEPVRFLPLFPMTANEAAWKRVHGAEALEERWLTQGCDLRDPARPQADLA